MSTNCIRCAVNERDGFDLLCAACREAAIPREEIQARADHAHDVQHQQQSEGRFPDDVKFMLDDDEDDSTDFDDLDDDEGDDFCPECLKDWPDCECS